MPRSLRPPALLRTRVTALVTGLAALLLIGAAVGWTVTTREAIHEEIEAASKVAEQWLQATQSDAATAPERLALIASVGRLRANTLEAFDTDGALRYRSPGPTYKAGRDAPAAFATLLTPVFEERVWQEGALTLRLVPDPSRAVLDAWDAFAFGAGWALAMLLLLALAVRHATARAMAPLTALENALHETAGGRFDIRLPCTGSGELDRLAARYNHMAEQLDSTLVRNARLEEDQAFVRALNQRLEDERRAIARELHDEFGQGITALRAIAGAIAQRSADNAALHGSAQALIAMSSQLQDNVRSILGHLRRPDANADKPLHDALRAYVAHWARCYPALSVAADIDALPATLPDTFCLTVLRVLQESLTNVARHADAHHVHISGTRRDGSFTLCVRDDGRGFDPAPDHAGYGLTGMRERIVHARGTLHIDRPATGGSRITACLPLPRQTIAAAAPGADTPTTEDTP